MKKFHTLFILYILFSSITNAQTFLGHNNGYYDIVSPKREVRATWIATIGGIDWPHSYAQNTPRSIEKQKEELRVILDKLQEAGMNTILLQTRVRGTTIYPSELEPWDGCLSGKPGVSPGYDALQFAIDECHKRGMELHAWIVTIPIGKWDGLGCKQMRKRYPNLVKKIGSDGYLNPEDAKTGDVIAELCDEIVKNYDIDGIHLDYIRYPEDWVIKVNKDKGRQNITRIAKKISDKVVARKPWVKMSCSPIGKADDLPRQYSNGWNAYSRVCQDAQGWLRDGIMDMLFPMMYFKGNNFYPFAMDWKQRSYGKVVVPGLGLYFMSPKEKNWPLTTISQEMEVLRQYGMGHCMYRSKFFLDNTKGIYDFTHKHFNVAPALPDAMTWKSSRIPGAPEVLRVDSATNTLTWSGAVNNSGASYLMYNIYRSSEWPVDISDAGNLMKIRHMDTDLQVPLTGGYYAVTAIDRYGNESDAIQMDCPTKTVSYNIPASTGKGLPLLECDGSKLKLAMNLSKNELVSIETLQHTSLKVVFGADIISVSDLPEGMYQVRIIGKKKAAHRVGYFRINPRKSI